MPGKRISELTALSGAASANNDDLVVFDADAGETKRISRSQLAEGMQTDVQVFTNKTINIQTNTLQGSDGSRLHLFTTVAALLADTGDYTTYAAGQIVEAGGFRYEVAASGASDHHLTTAGGVKLYVLPGDDGVFNVNAYGAAGDGSTDDNSELVTALSEKAVRLSDGTYLTASTITVQDTLHWLSGNGWRREVDNSYSGSVLKGDSSITNLLTVEPSGNDGTSNTDVTGVKFSDFAIQHEGSGHALKVDHIVWPVLDRLSIEGGETGVVLDNWSFFAEIQNCRIEGFTDTGVFIRGPGSQNAITNCQISSAGADQTDVLYGVRTQSEGAVIQGGQINVNRLDGAGIGVWFDNPFASGVQTYGKGGARGVLVEADIGFKIGTAGNSRWDNVILEDIRSDLGIGTDLIVQFTNTHDSQLFLPRIDRPAGGGKVAKWDGAEAINCGVVLGAQLFNAVFDVNAAAVDPWVHFVGTMTLGARALIHADTNLRVIVDNVRSGTIDLGRCERRGGVWDKGAISLSDDAVTSFALPDTAGILHLISTNGNDNQNRNAMIWYNNDNGISEIASGSDVTVDATNGTLSGTTGVDGVITIRFDNANNLLYVENRAGGFVGFIYNATQYSGV